VLHRLLRGFEADRTRTPGRVASAILEQPIGVVEDNRKRVGGRREWAATLAQSRDDVDEDRAEPFGAKMWDGHFVVSMPRDSVKSIAHPLLVLPGVDAIHPTETGLGAAALAAGTELLEQWKDTRDRRPGTERVRSFLCEHTS
jgi:hypothetical protein